MSMNRRDRLLEHLRRVALHGIGERRTDGQLLESFIAQRDESAFASLLRRHGPMVRSLCLRVLGNVHDADDAFQAAFLVLVRKASSVRPREAVGNWLYGVAYRTALEVRKRRARRQARETPLDSVPQPVNEPRDHCPELQAVLDREVSRLGDKYRLPVVLCELEGRSRKEVARQLAIPEGTLSSRLATARKKLAARLARYGFAVSATSLTVLFAESTASAGVPAALSIATTKAALLMAAGPAAGLVSSTVLTLTEGVLKTMFIAKLKTATLVLCGVAALGLGTGGALYQTRAGAADPPKVKRFDKERPKRVREVVQDPKRDRELEQGIEKWRRIAEEAQARERDLRAELEKAHREAKEQALRADEARAQAMKQLQRAERERAQAEEERIARENAVVEFEATRRRQGPPNEALEKVERARKQIMAEFEEHQKALQEQHQRLEAEQRELEADLKRKLVHLDELKARIMEEHKADQPDRRGEQPRRGADKLDQILERLERLEDRLHRLEKDRR